MKPRFRFIIEKTSFPISLIFKSVIYYFLATETVDLDETKEVLPLSSFTTKDSSVLRADNVTASWSMDYDNLTLENVSFTVDKV